MPQVQDMAELARRYCGLIDSVLDADAGWLQQIARLLPRLHATVAALGEPADDIEHTLVADLDARFELFSHLRTLLGERDSYWLEYDSCDEDGHDPTGSLADDLTDIYCELKYGLRLLEDAADDGDKQDQARQGWIRGFRAHWGQHLVDAERHLYALLARGQLTAA